jgi:hypothetical protein
MLRARAAAARAVSNVKAIWSLLLARERSRRNQP